MNNKIHQRGEYVRVELPAGGTIMPGYLVAESAGTFIPHATAGGAAEKAFAQEDALQGGTTLGVYRNGSYSGYTAAGIDGAGPDPVQVNICGPGALVLAMLAPTYNYTEGTFLISNGNGTLKPTTGTPATIIGVITSQGAINLSASGAVATLSQIRVL